MNIFFIEPDEGSNYENVIIGMDFSDTNNVQENFVVYMGFF